MTKEPPRFRHPARDIGQRILIYGPGGIGKTTLAASAPAPVFFDFDESLPRLTGLGNALIDPATTWDAMRSSLAANHWGGVSTIVIDSATKAEHLCVQHVLATVPADNGGRVSRLEAYGYGKGFQHVYGSFLALLADLDIHARSGRNVILIAHDCVANVPNPSGEDWQRYEPRLQLLSSGKSSIRHAVKEWADHVLFLGYDVVVSDGVARGQGTRTIWTAERPHCIAKSRTTSLQLVQPFTNLWQQLGVSQNAS